MINFILSSIMMSDDHSVYVRMYDCIIHFLAQSNISDTICLYSCVHVALLSYRQLQRSIENAKLTEAKMIYIFRNELW